LSAQRPQPGSDLSVAVAAQVGEQMVLDLTAQVSARERQQWADVEVGHQSNGG
jgi:hypothetical protein